MPETLIAGIGIMNQPFGVEGGQGQLFKELDRMGDMSATLPSFRLTPGLRSIIIWVGVFYKRFKPRSLSPCILGRVWYNQCICSKSQGIG